MTARNKNIPALRFKTDHGDQFPEWKETRLAELIEFRNGKGHEQFIDDKGKFIVVNSKFISTEGRVRKFCNTQISPLFKGEIVMVMSDIPNGKALAKCYLIDKDNHYTLNQRICALKQRNCSNEFLIYLVNRNEYYLGFDSGVGQTNLKKEEVINCPLVVPKSLSEQQKIASFLSAVDEKILQLTRKKELMEQYKKGVMQKLFSGKLRFKDEKGRAYPEWEERRLGDVLELQHGYQFRTTDFTKEGLAIIKISNVIGTGLNLDDLSFINPSRYPEFKRFEIQPGDILMSLTGNIGRVVEVDNLPFKLIQNYRVGKFVPYDLEFLSKQFTKHLLMSDSVFGRFGQLSNQSAQANFGKQDMDKIIVKIPSYSEQLKIAAFLSSIDTKIESVTGQINHTQLFKKGLLQQMFV